ncbi:MAG TPA: hypothetical protein VFV66_37100 [Nonomuraea sp.]|nr:hypothetical protein [Nonomuraea sp.]
MNAADRPDENAAADSELAAAITMAATQVGELFARPVPADSPRAHAHRAGVALARALNSLAAVIAAAHGTEATARERLVGDAEELHEAACAIVAERAGSAGIAHRAWVDAMADEDGGHPAIDHAEIRLHTLLDDGAPGTIAIQVSQLATTVRTPYLRAGRQWTVGAVTGHPPAAPAGDAAQVRLGSLFRQLAQVLEDETKRR